MKKTFILLYLLAIIASSFAQIQTGGIPPSLKLELGLPSIVINCENSAFKSMVNDQDDSIYKSYPFGLAIDVNISPMESGEWKTLEDGSRLWRVGIKSTGAFSIGLFFNPFELPEGAKLYVYNADYSFIAGAFTGKNNNSHKLLPVRLIPGDLIYIELYLPKGTKTGYSLVLNRLVYDYKNILADLSSQGEAKSCNIDIKCPDANDWQSDKNAVFRYIFYNSVTKRYEYCTGFLTNDAHHDTIPYFITAKHCLFDSAGAASFVAYFNYESLYCGGPKGTTSKTYTSVELIARAPTLDFSLAKFEVLPPFLYKPYFLGLDATGNQPQGAVAIHHPNGDVKKIAFENNTLATISLHDYEQNSFWWIKKWDKGTTEGGSSGSPLINHDHHAVGMLWGGYATCDNPINDYFTKISYSWDRFSGQNEQMRYWLSPDDTTIEIINGMDPYASIKSSCSEISSKIDTIVSLKQLSDTCWGYWTGQNCMNITGYAQLFKGEQRNDIAAVYLNIGSIKHSSPASFFTLKIWEADENLEPGNMITEKVIFMTDLFKNGYNYFEFDSVINTKQYFFAGYELYYNAIPDTFGILQSDSVSIDSYNYFVRTDDSWQRIDQFTAGKVKGVLDIKVYRCDSIPMVKVGIPEIQANISFNVFPNPANNYINISRQQSDNSDYSVRLFNLPGQQLIVTNWNYSQPDCFIDLSGITSGIYFLSFQSIEGYTVKKIIVLR